MNVPLPGFLNWLLNRHKKDCWSAISAFLSASEMLENAIKGARISWKLYSRIQKWKLPHPGQLEKVPFAFARPAVINWRTEGSENLTIKLWSICHFRNSPFLAGIAKWPVCVCVSVTVQRTVKLNESLQNVSCIICCISVSLYPQIPDLCLSYKWSIKISSLVSPYYPHPCINQTKAISIKLINTAHWRTCLPQESWCP